MIDDSTTQNSASDARHPAPESASDTAAPLAPSPQPSPSSPASASSSSRPLSANILALLATLDEGQRARLDRLAEMLIEANRHLNLTAVADPEGVRVRHVADSLAALPLIAALAPHPTPRGAVPELVDIGSGAGFPGLALAVALPGWRVVSVEATAKKARFQESVVQALGLENVEVVCERIELLGHQPEFRGRFALATARALAPLSVVAELALPLVALGGRVLAWKGRRVEEELEAAHAACDVLGGIIAGMVGYRLGQREEQRTNEKETTTKPRDAGTPANPESDPAVVPDPPSDLRIVVVQRLAPTPGKYPRNAGVIAKKPLGSPSSARHL